jgi:hypothetical protein
MHCPFDKRDESTAALGQIAGASSAKTAASLAAGEVSSAMS